MDIAKATGEAWTAGQLVYWDNTNKRLTTTSSGNGAARGAAAQAQASADTVGRALITGQAG
jgi:predicted RecA/RadA family phage recombinase